MDVFCSNISFKSIVIKDGGLNFIENNDGKDAVKKLVDSEAKYKDFNWNLIVNKDGYSLYSPMTKKTYAGEFFVRKHRKIENDNTVRDQLVIRTGEKNKNRFVIDYPSRTEVLKVYKNFKNAKGLSKMLILLEVLEQKLVDNRLKKRVLSIIKSNRVFS